MAYNPYIDQQPVNIIDPSGRLKDSGIRQFNFPYTPTVSNIINTNYSQAATTHSNFQQAFFESANNASFSVTAPILIENEDQAYHILRALDFFRGSMKMRFGKLDNDRGLPPPVLRFNAHGIFQNVPVVLTDFTYNLDADVSYIEIENKGKSASGGNKYDAFGDVLKRIEHRPVEDGVMTAEGRLRSGNTNTSNETIRMPVNGTFVFSLLATYSPKSIRENFTLDAYLKGNLRGKGYV
jgi:hypothetical protein